MKVGGYAASDYTYNFAPARYRSRSSGYRLRRLRRSSPASGGATAPPPAQLLASRRSVTHTQH